LDYWPGIWYILDVDIFVSVDSFKAFVESTAYWGPLVFVVLQILQVLVFVLPGEIAQIAGGYLFGTLWGTVLSVLGISLGSLLNFFLARNLGTRFVAKLFGQRRLDGFDVIRTSPRAAFAFFLLFLIPGLPKDLLCFVAGLSALRPLVFLGISMVGRFPGILGSAFMGSAAGEGRLDIAVAIAIGATVLFVLGMVYNERIRRFVDGRVAERNRSAMGGAPGLPPEGDGTRRTPDT
jgi:uncharacterized membrane protein YdjX (TVP38/TMEM64 family)